MNLPLPQPTSMLMTRVCPVLNPKPQLLPLDARHLVLERLPSTMTLTRLGTHAGIVSLLNGVPWAELSLVVV